MAKSFHTILSEGKLEVTHRGEEVTFNLQEWVKELSPIINDEDKLIEWAREYEVVIPVFHYFVKELLIAIRATARPAVNTKTDESDSMVRTAEECQERIDNFELKPIPVPGTGSNKAVSKAIEIERRKMIAAMTAAGVHEDIIKNTISQLV